MNIKLTVTAVNGINLSATREKIFESESMSSIDTNLNSVATPAVTGNSQFAYKEIDGIITMYTVSQTLSQIIDTISSGGVIDNIGVASSTTVVATEGGSSSVHVTTLTLTDFIVGKPVGAASLGFGASLYTLPAGTIAIKSCRQDVGLTSTDATIVADTPDLGIGTTVASGAVAVLGGTAAFENVMTGQTQGDCAGTEKKAVSVATLGILPTDSHVLYLNCADGWAGADTNIKATGTIVVEWVFLS